MLSIKNNRLRNSGWVVIFFLILAALLFPLILIAERISIEITMTHQLIILVISSVICQYLIGKPLSELTGKINRKWLMGCLTGMAIGGALMFIPAVLLTLTGYLNWRINAFLFPDILQGVVILLIAAIAEELLFRGFVFQRLISALGFWPAQCIIAGLFLLTHMHNPGMTGIVKTIATLNIFIASLMFGIAYFKTKSLALPIGMHFMANCMQGSILGFGVSGNSTPAMFTPKFDHAPIWLSGGDFGLEASALGLCTLVCITLYLQFGKVIPPPHQHGGSHDLVDPGTR